MGIKIKIWGAIFLVGWYFMGCGADGGNDESGFKGLVEDGVREEGKEGVVGKKVMGKKVMGKKVKKKKKELGEGLEGKELSCRGFLRVFGRILRGFIFWRRIWIVRG